MTSGCTHKTYTSFYSAKMEENNDNDKEKENVGINPCTNQRPSAQLHRKLFENIFLNENCQCAGLQTQYLSSCNSKVLCHQPCFSLFDAWKRKGQNEKKTRLHYFSDQLYFFIFDFYIDISWHCKSLHCISLHCISMHCFALQCISLHCSLLHCI